MKSVKCPTCRKRFDPGLDDDADDLPANLSTKVVCPYCDQWVRLPDGDPIPAPDVPGPVLERMRAQSRPIDQDDDRPRRRRRRDEDDDQPRRRSSRDEDDYGDDFRPRRPVRADGTGQAAMLTGIISLGVTVLSSVGACLCAPLAIGTIIGVIGGIVAIVLGFMARSRVPGSGRGLTGILTGFGALLIGIVVVILAAIGIGILMNAAPPNNGGPNPAPFQMKPNKVNRF